MSRISNIQICIKLLLGSTRFSNTRVYGYIDARNFIN